MSAAEKPFESSRTYVAATRIDPEPHVLSITIHAPTRPIRYESPKALAHSMLSATVAQAVNDRYRATTGRTLAYHMVGHAMIELKSAGGAESRYLLTAVSESGTGQTNDLMLRQQVGYTIALVGTRGEIQSYNHVARDIDESVESDVRAVRLRFLVSPPAASRMFDFFAEFARRGIHERYALTAYPLDQTGAGCTSLMAAFLEVAGLLDPEWAARWRVSLRVPEELFGDPERGIRVPPRKLLFGPRTRRWATESEPHRLVAFYDTTAMFDWANRLATCPVAHLPANAVREGPTEQALARHLGMPVVTIDLRHVPTPTGPMFR